MAIGRRASSSIPDGVAFSRMSIPSSRGAPALTARPGNARPIVAASALGARCIDVVYPKRRRSFGSRARPRSPIPLRRRRAKAHVCRPEGCRAGETPRRIRCRRICRHASRRRTAAERVDRADDARLLTQAIGERASAQLVRNSEYDPVQIREAKQLRQQRLEVVGQHMQRNEDGVERAAAEFRGEHLRRAHLLDRMPDDAEQPRPARDVVDLVGKSLAGLTHAYSPLPCRDSSVESRYNCAIRKPVACPCLRRLPPHSPLQLRDSKTRGMSLSPTLAAIRLSDIAPFARGGADRPPEPTFARRRSNVG